MASNSDYSEDDLALALAIGIQVIKDSDHLRRFLPEFFARFAFERGADHFEIHLYRVTDEPSQE